MWVDFEGVGDAAVNRGEVERGGCVGCGVGIRCVLRGFKQVWGYLREDARRGGGQGLALGAAGVVGHMVKQ